MRGACFTCVITVGVISCGQAKETSTPPRVVYSDPSTDGIGRVQQSGGMLFLVHGDRLTSIDLRSRVVRWTHYPTSDFTTSGGSVYVLSRSASNGDAILMDLDATSGRVSWSRPSEDGRLLADDYGPIVGNGRAIVQYDRRGKVRWSASSVENFKTIVAIPDHLLFVSGVASGAVIHPLASFIDSSTGKLVATNFLGDAIEVRPSAILAQAYGQANFDTWCGYADISKVDLFRDGKPSISSSRYLFEPIADNVQSSPCVDDRDNYPKAFASDDDLALVSGPVVAIFSINEPAHPNTVLKGERYLQGPSNRNLLLQNGSYLEAYDVVKKTHVRISDVDATFSTAQEGGIFFIADQGSISSYDTSTRKLRKRFRAICPIIKAIGSYESSNLVQCSETARTGPSRIYAL